MLRGKRRTGGRYVRAEQRSGPSVHDQVINGRDLDAVGDYFADERTPGGVRQGCFFFFQAFPDLHVSLDELLIIPALIDTTSAAMPVRRSITALSPRPLLGTNQLPGLAMARTPLTGSDGPSRLPDRDAIEP
jgi:hypothetical protein